METPWEKKTPGSWFKPGNTIGAKGRPTRAVERNYLDATIGCVSIPIWKAITVKAIELGLKGDAKARDWLTKVLIGNMDKLQVVIQNNTLDEISDDILKKLEEMSNE